MELRKVSKDYRAGSAIVHALKRVDLSVKEGEFLVVTGPSGSGKTTLLNMVGALDRPTSGEVILGGKDIGRLHEWRRADLRLRRIGFIFQEFNLIRSMTALENVRLPLSGLRPFGIGNTEKAMGLLELLDLEKKARRYPSQLSGGEQQRVAIARALANDPSLLIADEPTGELDSENGSMIMDILRDLNQRDGRTIIIVSHDPEVARRAKRIVRMKDGRISKG